MNMNLSLIDSTGKIVDKVYIKPINLLLSKNQNITHKLNNSYIQSTNVNNQRITIKNHSFDETFKKRILNDVKNSYNKNKIIINNTYESEKRDFTFRPKKQDSINNSEIINCFLQEKNIHNKIEFDPNIIVFKKNLIKTNIK